MNKIIYIFGIVFLGLSVICGLVNSIVVLLIGGQLYTLPAFIGWFFLVNIIAFISVLCLLRYYQYKKYWVTFSMGIVPLIANLSLELVIYRILESHVWTTYYVPAIFFYLGANILFALSLLLSNAGKSFWLKMTGIFSLIICLILLLPFIWHILYPIALINSTLEKVAQWTEIAGALIPVLFIMQFITEIKLLNTEKTHIPIQRSVKNILGFIAIIGSVCAVIFGVIIASACGTTIYWQNYNAEQSKQLVTLAGGPKVFFDNKNDSLHYLLIKPQDYDPRKKYPLVVCLPYGNYEASAAEVLSTDIYRKAYPAFIFVPYCLEGTGWGGIPGVHDRDSLACEAISALKDTAIDVNRRYVTGVSRGAYGAWRFICTHPYMFAAAIPVSGGGDPKLAPKAVHVAIWAFHGAKDKNVPVSASREMIQAIKQAGGNPKYTEYPDLDHNIWDQVSKTPGLWEWLFAQKRN